MRAMLALTPLAAFAVALVVARLLLTPAGRRMVLDRPNERSLHSHPIPRTGGLAIAAGVAVACALIQPPLAVTLAAAAALVALSFIDDLASLPTLARLAAHLAAAAAVLVWQVGYAEPVLLTVLVLAIAWYANLYNFMDGSDGLAGGMALFGFGAYAIAASLAGDAALASLAAGTALAAAVFLLANFPPAKIFMGDVGSVPLGFLAGGLDVLGWHSGAWPLWFPMLVFAPFACDATLTLLKRLARRERVWQAHREHYYQRLVRMGYGHRGTLWIEWAVMAACAVCALGAREAGNATQAAVIAGATAGLIVLAVWIDRQRAVGQLGEPLAHFLRGLALVDQPGQVAHLLGAIFGPGRRELRALVVAKE